MLISLQLVPSTYVVNSGDTLPSIAKAAYGDSSLWIDIADANGLSASSTLTAGQVLVLPSQTQLNTNGAETYKPYNLSSATGQTRRISLGRVTLAAVASSVKCL